MLPPNVPSPLTSKEEPVIVPVTVRFVEVTSVLLNVVVLNVFDSNLPKEPVEVDEPLTLFAANSNILVPPIFHLKELEYDLNLYLS